MKSDQLLPSDRVAIQQSTITGRPQAQSKSERRGMRMGYVLLRLLISVHHPEVKGSRYLNRGIVTEAIDVLFAATNLRPVLLDNMSLDGYTPFEQPGGSLDFGDDCYLVDPQRGPEGVLLFSVPEIGAQRAGFGLVMEFVLPAKKAASFATALVLAIPTAPVPAICAKAEAMPFWPRLYRRTENVGQAWDFFCRDYVTEVLASRVGPTFRLERELLGVQNRVGLRTGISGDECMPISVLSAARGRGPEDVYAAVAIETDSGRVPGGHYFNREALTVVFDTIANVFGWRPVLSEVYRTEGLMPLEEPGALIQTHTLPALDGRPDGRDQQLVLLVDENRNVQGRVGLFFDNGSRDSFYHDNAILALIINRAAVEPLFSKVAEAFSDRGVVCEIAPAV